MPKPTCIAMLAVLGAAPVTPASTAIGRLDPPSSVKQRSSYTTIKVAHSHQRVVACSLQRKEYEFRCQARREPADSATTLVLRPISGSPVPPKSTGRAIRITFPSHTGRQERALKLAVGKWELDWPGHKRLERFSASGAARVNVTLHTTTGKCIKRQQVCLLSSDASSQDVTISMKDI